MNVNEFKKHFSIVAKRVEKMECKTNQLAIGFKAVKLKDCVLVGYFHKTRIHRTKLRIEDFNWLRYLVPAGDKLHYVEGEICQNGKVIKKILVIKEL